MDPAMHDEARRIADMLDIGFLRPDANAGGPGGPPAA
jgi:hypothetical protein